MDITVNIQGLSELEKTFRNLPRATQNKAFRPALKAGAEIVKEAVIVNLKAETSAESSGFLSRNIRSYSMKNYRGMLRAGVRARKGAVYANKQDKDGPVRAGLVLGVLEYGKQNQPPRSPLRKAAREKAGQALDVVSREVRARMDQAIEDAKK